MSAIFFLCTSFTGCQLKNMVYKGLSFNFRITEVFALNTLLKCCSNIFLQVLTQHHLY